MAEFNNIKGIIFFDLDGTLLDNHSDKVPQSALKAIDKLKDGGYKVALSTGRDMDTHYSSRYMSVVNPDAVIHLNGNKISAEGRLLFRHIVDAALLREIYDFCKSNDICVGCSVGSEDFYINPAKKIKADMAYNSFLKRNFVPFEEIFDRGVEVSALSFAGDINTEGKVFERRFPNLRLFSFSDGQGADIVEVGFTKAEGMLKLCDYYGVAYDKTFAFGDSQNDIAILEQAGIGIAMGNADPLAKAAADYVTDNIDEDGVYKACLRFRLI